MKGFCQWSHWEQVRQTGNKSTATVIQEFNLKMSSVKWRPFCLGLNVLNIKKKHENLLPDPVLAGVLCSKPAETKNTKINIWTAGCLTVY